MKIKYTIPVMVSTAVLLAACGGGGSNAASSLKGKPSFNVSGTVPGTLIEAFCENGAYYSVNSDNNGTTKHPFSLKLPTDLSCRLVMTTNEDDPDNKVVTIIRFVNKDGVSSIAFSGTGDINLDYVDLALNRGEMSSDSNNDGVEDEPKDVILDDDDSESVDVIDEADDPLDEDNDDIIDVYEDDDDDGINNHDDDDDDDDGVMDKDDSDHDDDHDGDGIEDAEDVDDDNDGIEDEEDDDDDNDGIKDEVDGDSNPTVVTAPSAGRLLGSQCAQCHRTDANPDKGFEDLIGEEIYGDLVEMKRENKLELMHRQANGYSDEQIRLMDEYFDNLSETKGGE